MADRTVEGESARRVRKKTEYCLRTRANDAEPWSDEAVYSTRKARDAEAAFARIIGGFRTHSYQRREKQEEGSK